MQGNVVFLYKEKKTVQFSLGRERERQTDREIERQTER